MSDERYRASGTATTETSTLDTERAREDANRDPLTGEPGAHPVGTGVGAATGGTVGAVIGGAVGGPVGTLIGAAVGGLAGGLVGKGIAESVNPTEEDTYWREHYNTRPYTQGRSYEDLQPAYRYGWESRGRYADRGWNDVESDLERDWSTRGGSSLNWDEARPAIRDAWNRVESRSYGIQKGTAETTTATYGHEDYRPAYWYGWEAAQKYPGRRWAEIASEMERDWDKVRGVSRLPWSEAELAVHEAWDRAGSHQARPKRAASVPLQQLHDPATGLLDAVRVANYLSLPLKQFSEALGRNYSTVHRTPAAPSLQEALLSIKKSLTILEESLGNRASVLAWLNSPHHDLGGRTPMQVLLEGRAQTIEDMLEAALEGIPS